MNPFYCVISKLHGQNATETISKARICTYKPISRYAYVGKSKSRANFVLKLIILPSPTHFLVLNPNLDVHFGMGHFLTLFYAPEGPGRVRRARKPGLLICCLLDTIET